MIFSYPIYSNAIKRGMYYESNSNQIYGSNQYQRREMESMGRVCTSQVLYNRDYEFDSKDDANFCVSAYLKHNGWNNDFVMGTLPNGDYVAVLEKEIK